MLRNNSIKLGSLRTGLKSKYNSRDWAAIKINPSIAAGKRSGKEAASYVISAMDALIDDSRNRGRCEVFANMMTGLKV